MGLFINKDEHPEVFKNTEKIEEKNQIAYKSDFWTELVNEQKIANDSLNNSLKELKQLYEQKEQTSNERWQEIEIYLHDLKMIGREQEHSENHILEMLDKLNDQNKEILDNDTVYKQELMDEFSVIKKTNEDVAMRLEKYDSANEQLISKFDEQLKLQREMSEQVLDQHRKQEIVSNKLEEQEAVTEKIVRELHHIRSILFERSSFLAEKIEHGYKRTSSFIYHLITGSNQSKTLVIKGEKREVENHKESE